MEDRDLRRIRKFLMEGTEVGSKPTSTTVNSR